MEITRIGFEELEVLKEIESLCIFSSKKERVQFENAVCAKVGCVGYSTIAEDDFEAALEYAREILRARGRAVFQKQQQRWSHYGIKATA